MSNEIKLSSYPCDPEQLRNELRRQRLINEAKRQLREKALGDENVDFLAKTCPNLSRGEIKRTVKAAYPA